MISVGRQIGPENVVVHAEDEMESQLEWLLDLIESFSKTEKGIKDGSSIQLAWSLLKLYKRGQDLVVFEPDFDSNPFTEIRPDLTCTLKVIATQNLLIKRLNIADPVDCVFSDKIVLKKGCLELPRIYMERQYTKKGDSGWYIGPMNTNSGAPKLEELTAIHAFQLLKLRPTLVSVLGLPVGYMAIFNEQKMEAIVDPNNKNILT